ncbi:MAG: sensor histidine kinase, partial [Rufibacter sp.]
LGQWRQSALEAEQLKRATLKAQLDAIKSQLDPHFLFNNFNTLYGLIQEAPAQAGEFLLQLSDIYRYILQNREQEAVPLEEEIRVAKAYLFLLQNRYEEGLQVHWQLRPLAEVYQLSPLTLQMLLENAIKHNRVELDSPLHLHISIKDGYLEVQNNVQRRASVASTQLGLQQLKLRYAFLTQQEVQIWQTAESFTVRVPLLTLAPQPA